MASLFPTVATATQVATQVTIPVVLGDVALDDAGRPRFRGGEPVRVQGREAVAVWGYNALQTWRGSYAIHTLGYGSDMQALVGRGLSDGAQRAEVVRAIQACLTAHPSITGATVGELTLEGDTVHASVTVSTIYDGEVTIRV